MKQWIRIWIADAGMHLDKKMINDKLLGPAQACMLLMEGVRVSADLSLLLPDLLNKIAIEIKFKLSIRILSAAI